MRDSDEFQTRVMIKVHSPLKDRGNQAIYHERTEDL